MFSLSSTRLLCAIVLAIAVSPTVFGASVRADGIPSPDEYVSHVGGGAEIVDHGEFILDGQRQSCGKRPIVIDNNLDDYGAAYDGFLIMNSRLLARVSTPVKFWIFQHECGHQWYGPDEVTADCFAIKKLRGMRILDEKGLDQICNFISPAKGDMMHFSGSHRCESMRLCYADPSRKLRVKAPAKKPEENTQASGDSQSTGNSTGWLHWPW